MTDTSNTDGAALLPVTEADIDAQKEIAQIMVRWGPLWPSKVQELLARHRIATQEDAERAGVGVHSAPVGDEITAVMGKLEGYTPPETEQDWACVEAMQLIRRMSLRLSAHSGREILERLSTPAMSDLQRQEYDGEALGRFGHHPDPAIDFECEVEQIESIVSDLEKEMRQDEPIPLKRIERAVAFRVGGDPSAVAAKASLRGLERRAAALAHPAQARDEMTAQAVDETGGLVEALGKAIVFSAYRASDPLAIRFEFANDDDRVAAADAVDEAFLLGAHGIRAALKGEER